MINARRLGDVDYVAELDARSLFLTLSIEHDEVSHLVRWCRFDLPVVVLGQPFSGSFQYLLAPGMHSDHPMDIMPGGWVLGFMTGWPCGPGVEAVVRVEGRLVGGCGDRVVIRVPGHW